jgi:hypothetical protein
VQVLEVGRFEWDSALQHSVKEDTQGPDVHIEAFVTLISDDLRCQVSWCAALLLDDLTFVDESAHTEVADLDRAFNVHQDVVQLDVSVKDTPAVAVAKTEHDLLEHVLRFLLLQSLPLLHILQ